MEKSIYIINPNSNEDVTAAIVIACFSAPGLHTLREEYDIPIFGIAESGRIER